MDIVELWEQEIVQEQEKDKILKEEAIYNFYEITNEAEYLISNNLIDEAFDIKSIIKNVWEKIIKFIKTIRDWIKRVINKIKEVFSRIFGKNKSPDNGNTEVRSNSTTKDNSNGNTEVRSNNDTKEHSSNSTTKDNSNNTEVSSNSTSKDNSNSNVEVHSDSDTKDNSNGNAKEHSEEKFNGYIPQKQQDDFEKLMKIGEARNIENSYDVIDYYKEMLDNPGDFDNNGSHKFKHLPKSREGFKDQYSGASNGAIATLKYDIDRINDDLEDTINAIKTSDEFERLKANNYERTNMNKVNFRNIISMMEDTDKELAKFEKALEEIKEKFKHLSEDEKEIGLIKQYQSDMTKFCKNHLNYHKARLDVINIFLKSFNISKSEAEKINDKVKKQFDINNKNILTKNDSNYKYVYISTQKEFDEAEDIMSKMRDANDRRDWDTYRKFFNDFIRIIGVSHAGGMNISIARAGFAPYNGVKSARYSILKQNYRKIPIGNKTLYHEDEPGKTELVPYAIINGGKRFCPEPLVYAHLSTITNRYHQPIDSDDLKNRAYYKIVTPVNEVYQDTEIGKGSAVIIRTDQTLQLEEVDIKKYLQDKNAFKIPQLYLKQQNGGYTKAL